MFSNLKPCKIKIKFRARKINISEENDVMTLSIMTLGIMTPGITTLSITTLSIMALSIMQRILMLSVSYAQSHLCSVSLIDI